MPPPSEPMKRRLFQILVAFGQNGFLLGFTNKAIYQGSLKEYCTPTLNCYACPGAIFACPIGTIQHFAVVGGAIPAYVLGYLAAIGAVVGRMCCGWLCPFGFFQDLLYKVRSVKIAMPVVSEPVPAVVGQAMCGRTAPGTRRPSPIGAFT